jgi:hypothetical protein
MRSNLMDTATEYGQQATHALEKTATRIPTEWYLVGAVGSIGISLGLKLMGRNKDAEFVGHWAPTFLALGLLSKLVEHDQHTPRKSPGRR